MHEVRRERGRLVAGAALLVALTVGAAGCGSDAPIKRASHSPDPATKACRAKWSALADQVHGNENQTEPSALAERWNSVVATADYYATSARSSDCSSRLDAQKKAIGALESFGRSLRTYDMEYQLSAVQGRAAAYTPPQGHSGKKATSKKSTKQGKDAPSAAAVKKALATLRKQAPTATDDQRPGWQEAHVVDLGNKSAVTRARKDLDFLSQQSKAWRECDAALGLIRKALRS